MTIRDITTKIFKNIRQFLTTRGTDYPTAVGAENYTNVRCAASLLLRQISGGKNYRQYRHLSAILV
jgi:hypothetical protein